jgi:hypothetical protein
MYGASCFAYCCGYQCIQHAFEVVEEYRVGGAFEDEAQLDDWSQHDGWHAC